MVVAVSGQYRLKIGARTLKLPEGTVDVGRSSDCWLTLDDDLISRYHARFHVSEEGGVILEDLKSRNGTFVNGEGLDGKISLHHADKVRIGREVITYVELEDEEEESSDALRRTIGPGEDSKFPSLIGALVEKSLNMGKLKEAERYALALTNQLASAKVPVDHPTAVSAVNCLIGLAEKTSAGVWLDRVFRLHAAKGWIMTTAVLTKVRGALDRIPRVPGSGLRDYEAKLRAMAREGQDVPSKLMTDVAELADAYGN